MKSQRPGRARVIRPGDARAEFERTAKLRAQIDDERARHRIAEQDIAARRSAAALRQDPERRAVDMARVNARAAEEDRRHRSKIDTLNAKLNNKR